MTSRFDRVALGEILTKSEEKVTVRPDQSYPNFGIYSFGRGLFEKPPIDGMTTSAKTLYRARAGQFVYSRLFAFEGAYGVVPEEYDGWYVSNEFPLFDCDVERVDVRYLTLYFRQKRVWEEVAQLTTGVGDRRRRLKPEAMLSYPALLPPLSKQRLIVERVTGVTAKTQEVKTLSLETVSALEGICRALIYDRASLGSVSTPLRELLRLKQPDVERSAAEEYQFAGVYSFGRGVFAAGRKKGSEFSYSRLTRLSTGDFVYPKLMAWEGAFGVVPPSCDGFVVSPEFPVFGVNSALILPEVLDVYFRWPVIWPHVAAVSKGTNVRRRRLKPRDFLAFEFPLPPMHTQKRIRRITHHFERVNDLRKSADLYTDLTATSVFHSLVR